MKSVDEAKGLTHQFNNGLFTLTLRIPRLYLSGITDNGSELHPLAVRIVKSEANRFVRTNGTLIT